jgi:hypothetical protein
VGDSTCGVAPGAGIEIALSKMQSDAELRVGVAAGASKLAALFDAISSCVPITFSTNAALRSIGRRRLSNADPSLAFPLRSILALNRNLVRQACSLGTIADHKKTKSTRLQMHTCKANKLPKENKEIAKPVQRNGVQTELLPSPFNPIKRSGGAQKNLWN